jgi:hypothetical protein
MSANGGFIMSADLIHLPRPREARPEPKALGFFVRVGRNDHREMLELIATGESAIFGFVIDAHHAARHRELVTEARRRDFEIILDPKTQAMGLPGGHTDKLAALPWGLERHHIVADFEGRDGRERAQQIAEFASTNGFTQILGPTHLLSGPNDPWLRRDIDMMVWTADRIRAMRNEIGLIYPLAVPMDVLRKRAERAALISAITNAPCDGIWLKIENFGDDATGEKAAAYIEACRDFHERGVPIVADHVGGLPALGALAFGAVGGIAHGVTMQQNFKASSWRRPRVPSSGGPAWRVYLPQLDMLVKPAVAEAFLARSTRVRGRYGCRDTHCCPHGVRDMISRPARHALYQRAREIERLSSTPQTIRVRRYLDEHVRRVSDDVAAAASLSGLDEQFQRALHNKQREMSRFRQAMTYLAEESPSETVAAAPVRRGASDWRSH